MLSLIRCPKDQSPLKSDVRDACAAFITEGKLICAKCDRIYQIAEGIPVLLDAADLDAESRSEQTIRDATSRVVPGQPVGRIYTESDQMEMRPTIRALDIEPGQFVLEFGCGTGRYTLSLVEMGVSILGVDFSMESLRLLARRLPAGVSVGLLHADATNRCVAPDAFDRVLATLVSNLPTKEHRLSMVRVASEAVRRNGSFVFSTHHQSIVRRLLGLPPAGRYADCAIYRYHMREEELRREAGVYFRRISCRPICVGIPFTSWMGLSESTMSRIVERIPLLRQKGDLLLARTREPLHDPPEDEGAPSNHIFAYIFNTLKSKRAARPDSETESRREVM